MSRHGNQLRSPYGYSTLIELGMGVPFTAYLTMRLLNELVTSGVVQLMRPHRRSQRRQGQLPEHIREAREYYAPNREGPLTLL